MTAFERMSSNFCPKEDLIAKPCALQICSCASVWSNTEMDARDARSGQTEIQRAHSTGISIKNARTLQI